MPSVADLRKDSFNCAHLQCAVALFVAGVRDYLVVGGYEQVSVEAVCIGIWKFKGNPAPLQMVHVTCGDLRGRTFAAEPPKGKVSIEGGKSGFIFQSRGYITDCMVRVMDCMVDESL